MTSVTWSGELPIAYAPSMPASDSSANASPGSAARVLVVMAMEVEAAPLRAALGAEPIELPSWASRLPARLAEAPEVPGRPRVRLAVNGTDPISGVAAIGTSAAALTTQVGLNSGFDPDLVLTVGTAGGWSRHGSEIGDTFLAWPHFVCHDRRIDLPGFQAFGDGALPAADLRAHAESLGCRLGVVTTGDSLDESPTDRERILANGGMAKEMEAAAVAWICHLHDVPVGGVKTITDLVDTDVPTPEQFTANLAIASASLQRTTLALLERLGEAR